VAAGSNFVGLCPVHEVLVIGPDDDRQDRSSQQVQPMMEGSNYREQLLISNGVVLLCGAQGAGEKSDSAE
jgi:hypothetical protein